MRESLSISKRAATKLTVGFFTKITNVMWIIYDDNYDHDDNDDVILKSFNVNKWKCKVNNN